jgi:hypothetical protein
VELENITILIESIQHHFTDIPWHTMAATGHLDRAALARPRVPFAKREISDIIC